MAGNERVPAGEAEPIGRGCESLRRLKEPVKDVISVNWQIVLGDVVIDVLKVALRVSGQYDFVGHQGMVLERRRFTTSLTGVTWPFSTCWPPSARIFSSASVS